MLLVDDILLFPMTGILFVVRKIHEAAQEAIAGEGESLRRELSELYMMLETGQISEADFDAREGPLLDRLDAQEGNDTRERGER